MSREKQIDIDLAVEEMASAIREITVKCCKCEYYKDGSCLKPIDMGCNINEDILNECDALYNARYRKQSRNTVELPCRIGDKVYSVLKLEDMDHPIIDVLTVTEVGQRYIFCSAYNPPRDDITEEIPVERIGVDIFLSRLDAETALAKLKGVM